MGMLAISKVSDEMPQNWAFHHGLHCFAKIYLNLEILTCDPLICTKNHRRLIVSYQMEEFISIHGVIVSKWMGDCTSQEMVIQHYGWVSWCMF